jgi:hypothetical protein
MKVQFKSVFTMSLRSQHEPGVCGPLCSPVDIVVVIKDLRDIVKEIAGQALTLKDLQGH